MRHEIASYTIIRVEKQDSHGVLSSSRVSNNPVMCSCNITHGRRCFVERLAVVSATNTTRLTMRLIPTAGVGRRAEKVQAGEENNRSYCFEPGSRAFSQTQVFLSSHADTIIVARFVYTGQTLTG